MSGQGNREQQAKKLLQAMGQIDDRFVLEAMQEQWPGANKQEAQKAEQLQPKRRAGRMRRYSAWALTAAACLAVIVIGRFVSVSSVKRTAENATEISSVGKVSDAASDAVQGAASDAVQGAASDAVQGAASDAVSDAASDAVPDASGDAEADAAQEVENMIMGAQEAGSASEEVSAVSAEAGSASEKGFAGSAAEAAVESVEAASAEPAAEAAGPAVSIANPFVDVDTLEEAEKEAGFTITLPTLKETYDTVLCRAMKGKMIEVIYLDENQKERLRIRKGLNMEEDISGIWHEQAQAKTLETAGGIKVQVYGADPPGDGWGTAVWTQEDGKGARYSYSVDHGTSSFTTDEILNIVEEMSVK